MLIMRYNGGLGNQMFQFAAAATLADKLGADFYFDCDFFNHSRNRSYQIYIFQSDKREVKGLKYKALWAFRKHIGESFFDLNVYCEKDFNYEERFSKIRDNTYIYGFFQSHKYINEKLIKEYFTFKVPPDVQNARIIENMQNEDSISIHIRRGDYVAKKHYSKVYNHLDLSYYENALEKIADSVKKPVIYVFSDDIKWVSNNFNFNNCPKCKEKEARVEFISHNFADKSWEDLRLMTNCKHNVIANSSFSWWGAYLNPNPDKIVIAPKKWFQKIQNNPADLYPQNWIML